MIRSDAMAKLVLTSESGQNEEISFVPSPENVGVYGFVHLSIFQLPELL
jgi:hypothetical protein